LYLDEIIAAHRATARDDQRAADRLIGEAKAMPKPRGFREALLVASRSHLAVIAEVKRRSPSKGDLNPDLDAGVMAATYEGGGASCVSVLTDHEFFGGSAQDLSAVAGAIKLPVLRKDFTVSVNDVCDARLMGADCLLLIVAALDVSELRDFYSLGKEIGLDVLVEIHTESELEVALDIGADMIGVNQRNLATFVVDTDIAAKMAAKIPGSVVKVAESGVRGASDAKSLRLAGYDGVLVGESLVVSGDVPAKMKELLVD
jgi:indole-3-glycerol phosphate synthase